MTTLFNSLIGSLGKIINLGGSTKPPTIEIPGLEQLFRNVIKDPFRCRNDPTILLQHTALRNFKPIFGTKDSHLILLEKLGADSRAFANETAHLFQYIVESKRKTVSIYKTP